MRKKNLLIDEYPLLVLPSLAKAIGLNEAIALQQLHYWLENPKGGVELDGERWVYNTYEDWQKDNFPFWSIPTIQRVFASLESKGLIISKQLAAYDRKKYYRIHHINLIRWNVSSCDDATYQDDMIDDSNLIPSLTETTETKTKTTQSGTGLSEKEIQQANAKVDAMIANSKKAKYQNRDKIPEPYLIFADLYNELTKQEPTKRSIMEWFSTFEDWKSEGLQPEHIRAAWNYANRPEGGFPVGRPSALTNTAVAMKSKMTARSQKSEPVENDPFAGLKTYLASQETNQ
jgi:hypothetical protein